LNPAHCAFLNFEDPRLSLALSYTTIEALVERFRERHGAKRPLTFFLDEVQMVEGWQRFLRSAIDRPSGNRFVITGSNSDLLSGEMSSALTGRHITIELYPYDLREARRAAPGLDLASYLEMGGFPEPLTMTDGDRLRRQYFHDIIERDVRERLQARSSLPIRQVVQMAFESAGSEISLRRIAAATGVAVETAGSYLAAAESAYLLFSCPYFAFSERRRASRNRKYYPVDPGLRRVAVTATGQDAGRSLECAVYLALKRRFGEVYYWRERGEVDFVVRAEGRIIPVQVTWADPDERHRKSLDEFHERFPQADEAVWITAETFEQELGRLQEPQ
jgi:hypothetical protein